MTADRQARRLYVEGRSIVDDDAALEAYVDAVAAMLATGRGSCHEPAPAGGGATHDQAPEDRDESAGTDIAGR